MIQGNSNATYYHSVEYGLINRHYHLFQWFYICGPCTVDE